MIQRYLCSHCSAPIEAMSAAITTACPNCGRPWARGRQPRGPIACDLAGIRTRVGEFIERIGGDEAAQVGVDVASLISVVGELARAVAALNGTCTCKPLKVRRQVGPCPHYRANVALLKAGIAPAQVQALRAQIDRRIA